MIKNLLKGLVFAAGLTAAAAIAGPVNINTADAATLAMELDGVGEKTAAAIVTFREEHGRFKTPEELMLVKGVGEGIFNKNRENILVE